MFHARRRGRAQQGSDVSGILHPVQINGVGDHRDGQRRRLDHDFGQDAGAVLDRRNGVVQGHRKAHVTTCALRGQMKGESWQADFVQYFLPAGFSTGDRETGSLFLALPDCVRWDYDEPFAKTFLLCGETIHTWNPGEPAGRRFTLSGGDEPGIDLLRLRLEELRLRYNAQVTENEADVLTVILTPLDEANAITEASLRVDRQGRFLRGFSFRDREGNVSRFEISALEAHTEPEVFELPVDLDWLDQ